MSCCIPDGPGEAFEFGASAFDLAERLQTPVFVMLDLDIGMNSQLDAAVRLGRFAPLRPRQGAPHDELERAANFGRYHDVDGDGMPYRTLPGAHPTRGAYFTRGTSRDRFARYTEEARPTSTTWSGCCASSRPRAALLPRPILQKARAAGPRRRDLLRLDRRGDGRGASTFWPGRASTSTRCACAPFR